MIYPIENSELTIHHPIVLSLSKDRVTIHIDMPDAPNILLQHLQKRYGAETFQQQYTVDDILTLWAPQDKIVTIIQYLKSDIEHPFVMLYDLCGIDERDRIRKEEMPASDFYNSLSPFFFYTQSFYSFKSSIVG